MDRGSIPRASIIIAAVLAGVLRHWLPREINKNPGTLLTRRLNMASKKKLAAKRALAKRDQTPKPKGRSLYAQKARRTPGPLSPFYEAPEPTDGRGIDPSILHRGVSLDRPCGR